MKKGLLICLTFFALILSAKYSWAATYDWTGAAATGTKTDWTNAGNWKIGSNPAGSAPGASDDVRIGVASGITVTNWPIIAASTTVASLTMDITGGTTPSLTVNSPAVLTITGALATQDAGGGAGTMSITGTGTISAASFGLTASNTNTDYTITTAVSVTALNISGALTITTTHQGAHDSSITLNITGGATSVGGTITTTNSSSPSRCTLTVASGATLKLAASSAFSLTSTGGNTVTFSTGSTIEYSGAGQTVYTNLGLGSLTGGISYSNLTLSGSGIKQTNGTSANSLNISGNFTNSLTSNRSTTATTYADFTTNSTIVNFNGTTQNIAGGGGDGTDFKTLNFVGGTNTITSGKINVTSTGTLTLSSNATLAAGGFLTIKSDINGSGQVANIPSGSSITGNVNVERYLTGNASTSRGWRLLSSPVAASSGSGITPNLTYIHTMAYTTGSLGTSGGFDATGNPTFYFYRENMPPNSSGFTTGNFRGVKKINNTTVSTFSFDGGDSDASLPVGNGFLFFFRGDRSTSNPTTTTTIAKPTTITATGYLNQGSITVKPWFTGASTLSYTSGSGTVAGYNLVGNPYASSIDWDLVSKPTGLSTSIWIYNPTLKIYAVYTPGSGGTNFNGGSPNIIPTGQGFFVKATQSSVALTFTESVKSTSNVTTSSNLLLATAVQPPSVRIVLLQDSLNREESLVVFKPTASVNYVDDEDADYLIGESIVHISTKSPDNHDLAINTMPFSLTRQQIPLNVTVNRSGTYKLDLTQATNIPSRYKIYLVDASKKDSVDITKKPVYTFTADTTIANSLVNRFYLVINQSDSSAYKLTDLMAVKSTSGVGLLWKTVNESNSFTFTVERSNDGGATYSTLGSLASNGAGTYSFVDKSPQAGVNIYRLKQQDNSYGGLSYTSVSINYSASGANTNSVAVYPNPAISTIKLSVNEILKAIPDSTFPDYTIIITNSTGNVVKSVSTSQLASWQNDVSTFAPGIYFLRVVNNNTKTVIGSSKFINYKYL